MRFKGKIKELDKIVVSDPYYSEKVWCRYENNNVNAKNWDVDILIKKEKEKFLGITFSEIEFMILMHTQGQGCHIKDDQTFGYYSNNEVKEFKIGMDTASIALGINKYADEIKQSRNEAHPPCSLNTFADGMFGAVYEGKDGEKLNFICISGSIDGDIGYSMKDIIGYLTKQLEITDIEQVMEKDDLEVEM